MLLHNKLKANGYSTLNEFVHAWMNGSYPAYKEHIQIDKLLVVLRDKGTD